MAIKNHLVFITAAAVLAVFAVSFKSTPAAAKRACPALQKPIEVSVKTIPREIDYKLGISQKKLTGMAKNGLNTRLNANQRVLGLTSSGHSISYRMKSQTARLGAKRYCARISGVAMKILVTKLTVYILGKYRRGSCQYTAVIDHEHEHVATFQNGIENLERRFNDRLWAVIKNLRPGTGSTAQQAGKAAFRNLKNSISKLKAPIERQMLSRNRQIDTPLSYQRLTQQCSKW